MLNSRLGLFSVTCLRRFPLSRSYGVILPSSLTTLLPPACGFSPHLPVSVYGTGAHIAIAAFLDSLGSHTSLLLFAPHHTSVLRQRICLLSNLCAWPGLSKSRVVLPSCVTTVLNICSTGISTCCPSTTAFALALGPDLP